MSDSSQLPLYSITSNDTMAVGGTDTITLTSGSASYFNSGITSSSYTMAGSGISTVTINSFGPTGAVGTITIPDIQDSLFFPTEWVDSFPEWSRIEDMCKQYPGLKIAFENFKTVYQLVKDDYDNPKDET